MGTTITEKRLASGASGVPDLVTFGAAVKIIDESAYKVGGYLVLFSGPDDPDLVGDFFTKSTNYGPHETSLVYYSHGLNGKLERQELGQVSLKSDDLGIWVEGEINKANKYAKKILELAKQGKLGWSSGTAGHLVEKSPVKNAKGEIIAHQITKWPLGLDASLTPTPCEPRTRPDIMPIKAYAEFLKGATDGEATQYSIEEPVSEGGMDYAYTSKPKIGHGLAAKMATEHSDLLSRLFTNRTVNPSEFDHLSNLMSGSVVSYHTGINEDVRDRDINAWDHSEMQYKADGPGMKTVGDAVYACMTGCHNAGADHLLKRGYLTGDEHAALKSHFETVRSAHMGAMNESLKSRDLATHGSRYLGLKNFEEGGGLGLPLSDEVKHLTDASLLIIERAEALRDRFAGVKEVRSAKGKGLGPSACEKISEVLKGLSDVSEEIRKILDAPQSPRDRLAQMKEFAASMNAS
jgi:hypothetical protein